MREHLNPYERYELTGMSDEEREREAVEEAEESDYLVIRHTEPKTIDEIVEELEDIFNDNL